jgi:hypothetical protein
VLLKQSSKATCSSWCWMSPFAGVVAGVGLRLTCSHGMTGFRMHSGTTLLQGTCVQALYVHTAKK